MRPSSWTAAPRGPGAARWERLWAGLCAPARLSTALGELAASAGPEARGLVLVDLALLAPRPAAALARLRAACPGLYAVACAGEAASPALRAEALSAGALDLFLEGDSDESLSARLAAHLKRLFPGSDPPGVLSSGGLRVDLRAREALVLRGRSWRAVERLSAREFELLAALAREPGRALARAELVERLGERVGPEAVDRGVAALRRKLGSEGRRLKTARGIGYLLG